MDLSEIKSKNTVVGSSLFVMLCSGLMLSGCSEEPVDVSSSTVSADNDDELAQVENRQQTLTVSPERCRGCGRCVQIDPQHFTMSGRVAVVISNDNLSSQDLTLSIASCPDSAISII